MVLVEQLRQSTILTETRRQSDNHKTVGPKQLLIKFQTKCRICPNAMHTHHEVGLHEAPGRGDDGGSEDAADTYRRYQFSDVWGESEGDGAGRAQLAGLVADVKPANDHH